jgi:hypothetical protein
VRRLAIAAVAVTLVGGHAQASPASAAREFEGPPLGAKVGRLPPHLRRSDDCFVSRQFIDCEFTGPGGIHYVMRGDELVRKEVRRTAGETRWPYGLNGDETPEAIKEQLSTKYALRFNPDIALDGGRLLSAPTDERSGRCGLNFFFDAQSRLASATLYCTPPGD